MSYRWVPVFRCALCGATAPAEMWEDMPFGLRFLPRGWVGSERKGGECYCEECKEALRAVKREMVVDE